MRIIVIQRPLRERATKGVDAFAVTLRELAELMLITGSLCAYLHQARRSDLVVYVGWGIGLGLAPAAGLAVLLMDSEMDRSVEATLATLMVIGVLIMATSMVGSAGSIRGRVQLFLDAWLERPGASIVVVAFVALASFRESFEVAVFMRSIGMRAGSLDALLGLVLGIAAAGLLVPVWKYLRVRSRPRFPQG